MRRKVGLHSHLGNEGVEERSKVSSHESSVIILIWSACGNSNTQTADQYDLSVKSSTLVV